MENDIEWYIEQCYRHYSKTYHTPLHIAKKELPIEEVILIYMQDEMADWTADEMADWKTKVDETPKIYVAAPEYVDQEEMNEDLWVAQQTAILKQQEEQEKKKKEDVMAKTHEAIEKLTQSLKNIPTQSKFVTAIPQEKK
jgi:hypothetical protein